MMTLQEFNKEHFPNKFAVEIDDKEDAISYFHSKMSCCWGNGIVEGTGWAVVGQPSIQSKGDMPTVFVCKTSLLDVDTILKEQGERKAFRQEVINKPVRRGFSCRA